jgi:hypothetical protein
MKMEMQAQYIYTHICSDRKRMNFLSSQQDEILEISMNKCRAPVESKYSNEDANMK